MITKTRMFTGLFVFLLILICASVALAQPWKGWRGSGGWGIGGNYQRMYNPATVETLSGTVESVEQIIPNKGMSRGVHLMLKTEKETIAIHLGPSWFVERLDIKINKGDGIEVTGSRVNFDGKPAVIAAEVKKGESVLVLRDSSGIPVWSGRKR